MAQQQVRYLEVEGSAGACLQLLDQCTHGPDNCHGFLGTKQGLQARHAARACVIELPQLSRTCIIVQSSQHDMPYGLAMQIGGRSWKMTCTAQWAQGQGPSGAPQ